MRKVARRLRPKPNLKELSRNVPSVTEEETENLIMNGRPLALTLHFANAKLQHHLVQNHFVFILEFGILYTAHRCSFLSYENFIDVTTRRIIIKEDNFVVM